ncbi:MAG TPA: hypothetical protein VN706_21460 [Gemmatimonadaceae bacterium]|nr:hypothetical protein [Gemmatimonadaceae bacterium]
MTRWWRYVAGAAAVVGVAGCIDKSVATMPSGRSSSELRLVLSSSFARQTSAAPTAVNIIVLYVAATGPSPILLSQKFNLSDTTQQIPLTVDLRACLADENRIGPRDSCPIVVDLDFLDASGTVVDNTSIGPLAEQPGTASVPLSVATDVTDTSFVRLGDSVAVSTTPPAGATYESSDTSVAVVTSGGIIVSRNVGATTVRTRTSSGVTASRVFVSPRPDHALGANTFLTCALDAFGQPFCWGTNNLGQLGVAGATSSPTPVRVAVPAQERFTQISVGDRHVCALSTKRTIYCWGVNTAGQLGNGTTSATGLPVQVTSTVPFTSLSVGSSFACALADDSSAYCWGANAGRLGTSDTSTKTTPTPVSGGLKFQVIAAGGVSACGLDASGIAHCWGQSSFLTLGQRGFTSRLTTTPLTVQSPPLKTLVSSFVDVCGVTTTNSAVCWGINEFGSLGNGSLTTPDTLPTTVGGGIQWSSITQGPANNIETVTCGVSTAGTGFCWGASDEGQLGAVPPPATTCNVTTLGGVFPCTGTPVAVTTTSKFSYISAGATHACGITTTHQLLCWGGNTQGEIGDGSLTQRATPVVVTGLRAP